MLEPLNPKSVAEFDQMLATVETMIPPVLFALHKGLLTAGFSEFQAMHLCSVYLTASVQASSVQAPRKTKLD